MQEHTGDGIAFNIKRIKIDGFWILPARKLSKGRRQKATDTFDQGAMT